MSMRESAMSSTSAGTAVPFAPPYSAHDAKRRISEDAHEWRVSEILTRNVITAEPDFSLEAVISMMLNAECGAIPIVDHRRRPIGIVTITDALREWTARGEEETHETHRDRYEHDGLHSTRVARATVSEIMVPFVLTLPEDATVAEASATMAQLKIHQLVVTDRDRAVVGMVTTLDIAAWIARVEAA